MTTQAKNKPKSIIKLRKRSAKTATQLQKIIQPLNDRINPINMMVWWDGEEYAINTEAANRSLGSSFCLDDYRLAQLMAMTDRQLETFLKGF